MGRIADALKKAQRERDAKLRLGVDAGNQWGGTGPGAAAQRGTASDSAVAAPPLDTGPDARINTSTRTDAEPAIDGGVRIPSRVPAPHPPLPSSRAAAEPAGLWPSHRCSRPLAPLPKWDVASVVLAVHDRSSSIVEQYRAVRTWLMSHSALGEHNCVAFTSSVAQEGKTVSTANLAVVLAEIRHLNILAVDADFRRGSMARLYHLQNSPGLADVLSGRATLADAIVQTPLRNLSFLPAGKCLGLSPTELFNSHEASLVFDEIRERYHFVLIDTPPVQSYSDVGVIGALCSGIVVVVRMHKTPSTLVRQSVQWLQSNNLNVIGCIAAATNRKAARLVYQYGKES
ncbi:MAG: CpsD/CapB family tyrosine-protein kinase [Phycisphaerae bacterium]